MKYFLGCLITIFITTQSYALTESTKSSLHLAALVDETDDLDSIRAIVEQHPQEVEAAKVAFQDDPTLKNKEKEAKLLKKFKRRLPEFKEKIKKDIEAKDETELNRFILKIESAATHQGDTDLLDKLDKVSYVSTSEKKASLISIMQTQVEVGLPALIHYYVETGTWPTENNSEVHYVHSSSGGIWFPDGLHNIGGNKAGKIYAEILGVLLILLIFGISYTLYLIFIAALLVMAVKSLLIDLKTSQPERIADRNQRKAEKAEKKRRKIMSDAATKALYFVP